VEDLMATTSPTRIDDELYASAKAVGALMSRSASQQIAHWARIGRELEAAGSVSLRDVARVLDGRAEYDGLGAHDQAVVRAEWAGRMSDRVAELDFDREFTGADESFSELDEHGRAVRRGAPTTG
jgi:hypothetical protein